MNKEHGSASRGIVDIPTRLAPRETSILYRQTQENFIKKDENYLQKEGGLYQDPQRKQRKNRKENSKNSRYRFQIKGVCN